MSARPARTQRTPRLTAATVVDTALRVARAEGLPAVSMRRLAEECGVSAMALYRHVADREDLLIRMLDVVADGVAPPPATGTPRERLTAVLHGMHDAFHRDPWVVQVLATEGLASTRVLPVLEVVFAAFADAGIPPQRARDSYAMLFSFLFGETLVTHSDHEGTQARRMMRELDPERYPRLAAAIATGAPPGTRDRERFALNLERLLDGVLGA
ncbi:TetR/AcrR family transcriptional regulator C-terminal domain-containing protein [Streptomyces sp. LE64]|uniref:TetR/AcrR family transcriptional regulator C-terminal domain-containing protein n=1 Tax=Streptomyces sp. LE64 TaxID=3448653 RepID=UPI0040423911